MACIIDVLFKKILCSSLLFVVVASRPSTGSKIFDVFDVRRYGAKGDSKTDNVNAFIKAWKDACSHSGRSRVYIPQGTFYMSDVIFSGLCKGKIVFFISGTLLALVDPKKIKQTIWINFRYVDNLVVSGGGTIDGQGSHSWSSIACRNNSSPRLPAKSYRSHVKFFFKSSGEFFYKFWHFSEHGILFREKLRIRRIKSLNSKAEHLNIFAVDNLNITRVNITAPGNSPNTDGIKIAFSSNIKIWNSHIGTGDDCIAILSGNTNFDIRNITCGPGHGISVGSLGWNKREKNVKGFTVRDPVFTGTSNGIRFKTRESSVSEITVSNFLYDNIEMVDVIHPINIEQTYCACSPCPKLGDSHIQIRNVTLKNVWGTSKNRVAVNMHCSKSFPCKDIQLIDINLKHHGPDGPATALCENVKGSAHGKMAPPSCLK